MKLIYGIEDKPKFSKTLVFAFQQMIAIMAATLLVPMLVSTVNLTLDPAAALFGAGAGTIAAAGSTAFNTITGDTSASLTDSILHAADAVAVHAESDDVIGTYAGQGVGAGTIALGLSVAMSERSGATTATVSGSAVKETGTGIGTLTMKSGVDDTNINNAIVEQDALNVQTSLEDKRAEEKMDGIAVSATSATTYKTLTINGGGVS